MTTFAYVRVSTKEQNIDRQIAALEQYDISQKNIYCDRQSGKDFDRPEYKRLMKRIREGDLLIVKSIDRLGRNYNEILKEWQKITKEIKADILVLDMPLLDTRVKEKDVTGTFVADLVLQILAYVAETERAFIRQRQREGIQAAKDRGVKFGRPGKDRPEEFEMVLEMWERREISARKAAKMLSITHKTFLRWAEKSKVDEKSTTLVSIPGLNNTHRICYYL